tara:strand:- start:875 stop:1030 length:156 start_codon:yes stop_codon:yes gene_type:complete
MKIKKIEFTPKGGYIEFSMQDFAHNLVYGAQELNAKLERKQTKNENDEQND